MQIIITETNELTELDLRVLRALVGGEAVSTPVSSTKAASTPEPKATPAKAAPKAEKKAEPEPEDDEPETGEDDAPEVTLKDAVALATKLVSNGKAAAVKQALSDLGAKRVSELKESDVPAFISALS